MTQRTSIASVTSRITNASLLCAAILVVGFVATTVQAQTYTILHNFTGGSDGYYPQAGPTLNGTSNLFGAAGPIAVFRLRQSDGNWAFTPIFDFSNGYFPSGRLTFGPGGALYGATLTGGIPNCYDGGGCGVVFSMRPASTVCKTSSCPWSLKTLYQFNPLSLPNDGYSPQGGLVFDSAGNIYGTTSIGGSNGQGNVFELSPSGNTWTETILHAFSGPDGVTPNGNMVLDPAGNLIGTAQFGGTGGSCRGQGCGVIFELTPTSSGWVESTLYNFTPGVGVLPTGGLISDAAGNLYGTTTIAGPNNGGTVYELTPSNGSYTYQTLYASGGPGSTGPSGLLAIDGSGNLYGVTSGQGAFSLGNVFKLTHSGGQWIYSDLHDFAGAPDGAGPQDGPTVDPSGNLYGTASTGGTGAGCPYGCGVVWEIEP